MRVAVVGGGLAGLSAALELVDGGHEVTLHEARPTLGGAVQTLPRREGDPEPPPDNGQHVALGCFTEYVRFLERVGERGSVRRVPLELPVLDEHGRSAAISPSALALLRYRHVSLGERLRILRALARWGDSSGETFADALRARGQSQRAIDRFWDVFIRPALNLRSEEASAEAGDFTVRTALLGERSDSDLLLPARPLGEMHGDAAGRALEAAGATVLTNSRVESLDELRRGRDRRRRPAARERAPARRARAAARGLADRQRPPLVRPRPARLAAGRPARQRRALGLRPRRADRLAAGARAVPDRRLLRRAGADGAARPRAGRADRLRADRPARPCRAALVAGQPRARGDDRGAARQRGAPSRTADEQAKRHARGRVDRHRLAGDDGRRDSQRSRRRPRPDRRPARRWRHERHDRDASRRRDRGRDDAAARAPAPGRLLGRRARVERDHDRAAPLLAPRARPAHARSSTARSPTSCWRGSATTARGRSGSTAPATSRRRSRPTRR